MRHKIERIIRYANEKTLNYLMSKPWGMQIFNRCTQPYLGGHSLDEAIATAKKLHKRRIAATFDVLGEAATTPEASERYVQGYRDLIQKIETEFGVDISDSVSLKPTAICQVTQEHTQIVAGTTDLPTRLEELLNAAGRRRVTLDMEDHHWTDVSLDTAQQMWTNGAQNLGIVLQSRLYRTSNTDVQKYIASPLTDGTYSKISARNIRVRACIGIYQEPSDIALQTKPDAKEALIKLVEQLFDAGVYVEIATHDLKVLEKIEREVIKPRLQKKSITKERFELQALIGVPNSDRIAQKYGHFGKGYTVRFYVPYTLQQGDEIPYLKRRALANPEFGLLVLKNMGQRVLEYISSPLRYFSK